MQCDHFLNTHKDWQRIHQANTAMAAKMLLSENDHTHVAISSKKAAQIYGLEVLETGIADLSNNTTRFVIITNARRFLKNANKTSIVFETANEAGTLYNLLSHIIYNGLNMYKIESRPVSYTHLSSASNLNSVISSLSNESLWNEDSSDYSKDKVYDTVNNFVSAYNTLITNINTVGSTIENTYKTKLDKLVTDNKEALAAVGITVDDNGKLSVDTDKLKSADMSELKKMLGSESELMKGIKEQSGSVNNIVSEALSIQKSLSGLYNSSSSSVDVSDLLYGTSYDSKG